MWTFPDLQRRARRNARNATLEARARRLEREATAAYLARHTPNAGPSRQAAGHRA